MNEEDIGKKLTNHWSLLQAGVRERYHDTFQELANSDPEKAIQEFSKFLESALSLGNNFFKGYMCGGPAPEASVPLLNTIGSFYPSLKRDLRKIALKKSLNFLDGLNYLNSQNNVECIHEPWLVGDIIINRWLYWSGFQEYVDKLKNKVIWEDLKGELIREEGDKEILDVKSNFWFAYTLTTKKYGKEEIRDKFAEFFPEIMDRTLDTVAADIAYKAAYFSINKNQDGKLVPYREGIEKRLNRYAKKYKSKLISKINEKKWILFSEHPNIEVVPFLEREDSKIV